MKHAKGKQNLSSPLASPRGVYDMPFPAPQYREVRMVADDGVVLVEIRIHERAQRAQLTDPVPTLRAWLEQICETEERERAGGLRLLP
jgi:hypothetical protein